MASVEDEVLDQVVREIARLFSQITLTDEEKAFMRDRGFKLAGGELDAFVADPNMSNMRPFVIAMAIATALGPFPVLQALDALPPEVDC